LPELCKEKVDILRDITDMYSFPGVDPALTPVVLLNSYNSPLRHVVLSLFYILGKGNLERRPNLPKAQR
jgi:hypothetical protein